MWSVRKLFGFILCLGFLAGCANGGSGQTVETPALAVLSGGTIRISSNKFTPPGYPWNIIVLVVQPPAPTQTPGTGNAVMDGSNAASPPATDATPPAPAAAPGPTSQVLVTGSIVHSGYDGGDFLVEARPAKDCGTELCADLDAKPFASVKISKPGYFSLVMNKSDATVFVVATYSHPTAGTSTKDQNLGVVSDRVNDIVLDFSPAPAPSDQAPADQPALSPEEAKAIGDLFTQAQEAQASLNDMIHGALDGLI
jgi:hypothetical protein